MAVRRAVLGDAHVDRTETNKTAFDEDYQRLITESAWGSVWTRESRLKGSHLHDDSKCRECM
jgi:alkylhydroperoxidase/carboxymuconolactone decarboxylase family protein YurZ